MRRSRFLFVLLSAMCLAVLPGPVQAQEDGDAAAAPEVPEARQPAVPLPRDRPAQPDPESGPDDGAADEAEDEAEPAPAEPETEAPEGGKGPQDEAAPERQAPTRIYQTACPAVLTGSVEADLLPPIAEGQCRVRSPLSITGVMANGRMIPFSGPAILNCPMATVLPQWVAAVEGFLQARENTGIETILTGTAYMCRGRNRDATADVSEHGFANALDLTGFVLQDGRRMTLPEGWEEALSAEGRALRFAHDVGCALFTTTLGPEANALHADHLHLDLGCHGGACTARICE